MSTPSETIRTATSQGSDDVAKRAISVEACGIVRGHEPRRGPEAGAEQPCNAAGMLAVGRDHETRRVRLLPAHLRQAARSQPQARWEANRPRARARCGDAGSPGWRRACRRRSPRGPIRRAPSTPSGRSWSGRRPAAPRAGRRAPRSTRTRSRARPGRPCTSRTGSRTCPSETACPRARAAARPRRTRAGSPRPRPGPRLHGGARRARRTSPRASRAKSGAFVATWW